MCEDTTYLWGEKKVAPFGGHRIDIGWFLFPVDNYA
jgi:hypothetical protein